MALSAPSHRFRPISLVMLAAIAGVGLWLFSPWQGGASPDGGESSPNQLPSMLSRSGDVVVETDGDSITRLIVPVSLRGQDPVDLSDGKLRAETSLAETALAAVPTTFTVEWQNADGDQMLEVGETALFTVDFPPNSSVRELNPLRLVFRHVDGPTLIVEDVLGR